MSYAAKTVLAFGVYMAGQGIILMIAPNVLLSLFGIPEANEVWVRVVGLSLCIFAFYYIRASLLNITEFFKLTVQGRILQFILFLALVGFGLGKPILLLFAGVEMASGLWTYSALKN
ncbi:MAG: hypothetical protein SFU98_20620 [Leptospiraceae bacterium]|nr:hypothetical protein [Leptospiraceae bacterium]